jgi:hypothetical protein
MIRSILEISIILNHPDFEPSLDQSSENIELASSFFSLMVEITKKYRNRKLGMI